jgi:hypothetical protein
MDTNVSVSELVAFCELGDPAEYRGSPGGRSFNVVEYAVLSDGREVVLLDDRGWTEWTHGLGPGEVWPLTARQVRGNVLNVVLPDNAETTGEDHEWERFLERLRDAGVILPVDELRRRPYRVVFGPRLLAELATE